MGLEKLHPDVSKDSDEISIEAFMEFVSDQLDINIPKAFTNLTDFSRFVKHRIIGFKTHSAEDITLDE